MIDSIARGLRESQESTTTSVYARVVDSFAGWPETRYKRVRVQERERWIDQIVRGARFEMGAYDIWPSLLYLIDSLIQNIAANIHQTGP